MRQTKGTSFFAKLFSRPARAFGAITPIMLLLAACGTPAPTPTSVIGTSLPVTAERFMAATAHPLASQAASDILNRGGSAVDAAIAAQMVLTLVEPQSSGIGGGGFLLSFTKSSGDIKAYDGRESAPASATPDLFLDDDGAKLPWFEANIGGRAVGVPGTIAMLYQAHQDHGRLDWADLFTPAITLAREGFAVSERLHRMITSAERLKDFPDSRALYFTEAGEPLPVGTILTNPDLAETFERIATEGPSAFYTGAIAEAIVKAVSEAPVQPRPMTLADLADYKAIKREPICSFYRVSLICGMPPPSSGGIAIAQTLGMLHRFDMATWGPNDYQGWHLLAEASRLAFADRNTYVGDSDFVPVPIGALTDGRYLAERASEISLTSAPGDKPVFPGVPGLLTETTYPANPQTADKGTSTTHLSIVDADGNAVAMTTSLNIPFGSMMTVKGFLLNSELTDFDFNPVLAGGPAPNRVEPGKRPRSSMSPTLVFAGDGSLVLSVGSPGGSNIIGYVLKTLVASLDWNMDMQSAISLGTILNKNGATIIEQEAGFDFVAFRLEQLGHVTQPLRWGSGLQGIRLRPDGILEGGADPRREGVVMGE